MADQHEADVAAVLDEHIRRILGQYEAKAKGFRTVFGWLLAFAAFFLFLVLFPYLSIQYELQEIPGKIDSLRAQIAGRQERIDAYRASSIGFERLRDEIRTGPGLLREFVQGLFHANWDEPALAPEALLGGAGGASLQPPVQEPLPFVQQALPSFAVQAPLDAPPAASCTGLEGEAAISCMVAEYVRSRFAGYRAILENEVLGPLRGIGNGGAEILEPRTLNEGLDALEFGFEHRLAERPTFWRTVQEKEGFFVKLEDDVEAFWRTYEEIVDGQAELLRREVGELAAVEKRLTATAAELEALKIDFKSRLDNVETPFGQLPVGLNEAVLAFPVLLAVGFLVSASQLADATRLRAAFHGLYQRKDQSRAILDDRQVALVAPLWLDPADAEQNKGFNGALLALPLVVFLVAIAVVFYGWWRTDSFRAVGSINLGIFAGLYVLSFFAFLGGTIRLRTSIARYESQVSGMSTAFEDSRVRSVKIDR